MYSQEAEKARMTVSRKGHDFHESVGRFVTYHRMTIVSLRGDGKAVVLRTPGGYLIQVVEGDNPPRY